MTAFLQLSAIVLISLVAAGGTWLARGTSKAEAPSSCDPASLSEDEICPSDVAGNVLWVDARSRREWEESGLEGSILWNLDPNEDEIGMEAGAVVRIAAGVEQVVVYCGSESCGTSRQIARRIRSLGLGPPVKTLHGGWDALRDSNPAP